MHIANIELTSESQRLYQVRFRRGSGSSEMQCDCVTAFHNYYIFHHWPSASLTSAAMLTMNQVQRSIHPKLKAVSFRTKSSMSNTPQYRDDENDSIGDQLELGHNDISATHPRWYREGPRGCFRCWSSRWKSMSREKRRRLCRWMMIGIVILTLIGVIVAL